MSLKRQGGGGGVLGVQLLGYSKEMREGDMSMSICLFSLCFHSSGISVQRTLATLRVHVYRLREMVTCCLTHLLSFVRYK